MGTCEKFCRGQMACGEVGYCSCGTDCKDMAAATRLQGAAVTLTTATTTGIPVSDCVAKLYQHGDFTGWKAVFPIGEFDWDAMMAQGALSDATSAIKVFGLTGCRVEVFEHGNFTGWKAGFRIGDYDQAAMIAKSVYNAGISSIKVFVDKTNPSVMVFSSPSPMALASAFGTRLGSIPILHHERMIMLWSWRA